MTNTTSDDTPQVVGAGSVTRDQIKLDLEHWRAKKLHFEQTHNAKGVQVANLMLDKYLDSYNNAPV